MYLVAVGQDRRFDRSTVDIGFVEAADVHDAVLSVFRSKLGMPPADGDVVEKDVAARKSPGNCDGLIQQEFRRPMACPGPRPVAVSANQRSNTVTGINTLTCVFCELDRRERTII